MLLALLTVDSANVRMVGSVEWDAGIGKEPFGIYLKLQRIGSMRYALANLEGVGVLKIDITDPTNPVITDTIRIDTAMFRPSEDIDSIVSAKCLDFDVIGRWLVMGLYVIIMKISDSDTTYTAYTGLQFVDLGNDSTVRMVELSIGGIHTMYIDSNRVNSEGARMYLNLYFRPMYILRLDTGGIDSAAIPDSEVVRTKDFLPIATGYYHHDIYVKHGIYTDEVYTFSHRGGSICRASSGLTMKVEIDTSDRIVNTDTIVKCSGYGLSHSGMIYQDSILINFYENPKGPMVLYKLNTSRDAIEETMAVYRATGFGEESSVHEGEVKDGRIYVAYYWGGLRIYDIREPRRIIPVGYYDFYDEDTSESIYNGASDVKIDDRGYIYVLGAKGRGISEIYHGGGLYIFSFDTSYVLDTLRVSGCGYDKRIRVLGWEHEVENDTIIMPRDTYKLEISYSFDSVDIVIDTFEAYVGGNTALILPQCEGLAYVGDNKVEFIGKDVVGIIKLNDKLAWLQSVGLAYWSKGGIIGKGKWVGMADGRDICGTVDVVWFENYTLKYGIIDRLSGNFRFVDTLSKGGDWKDIRYINLVRVWDTLNNYKLHLIFVGDSFIVHNTYDPYLPCAITTTRPILIRSETLWVVRNITGLAVDEYSSGSEKIHMVWKSGDTLWYANWDGSGWRDTFSITITNNLFNILQPTIRVEGGDVYAGWIEDLALARYGIMVGVGARKNRGDTTWRIFRPLYISNRLSRVHYSGVGFYVLGYERIISSDILAINPDSVIIINLSNNRESIDMWPYSSAVMRPFSRGVLFRTVWEEVEGGKRRVRVSARSYTRISPLRVSPPAVFRVMGRGIYIGDSGGVYVVRVDSGRVVLRLGGEDMGVFEGGEEVVVPKWVHMDGLVEIEAIGGRVSLYHYWGEVSISGPMGVGISRGGNVVIGKGYVIAEGEGVLRIYDLAGRLRKEEVV
ncbi:MAG: hypothetical protein ABIL36_06790, partial [candidate division WOR-3 bacterium]